MGPYQTNGQLSYYLPGTSMASPHVMGIVALMAQAKPRLTAGQAEAALESAAYATGVGSMPEDSGVGAITRPAGQNTGLPRDIAW